MRTAGVATVHRSLVGLALLLVSVLHGAATIHADGPVVVPETPFSVSAGLNAGKRSPTGEGAAVFKREEGGRDAVVFDITGGTSWARATYHVVPLDVRGYLQLVLSIRGSNGVDPLYLRIRDSEERVASVRVGPLGATWQEIKVPLGDFRPDGGFDPTRVTSLSLVWFKPSKQRVAVAQMALVPGKPGWRHSDRDVVLKVFGKRSLRSVKHIETAHFHVWSDSSNTRKRLPKLLESALSDTARWLSIPERSLEQFKLPVFVFKSAKGYRRYCTETLGWTQAEAQRSPSSGSYWAIVMQQQGKQEGEIYRRVGKSIFQHAVGVGGGSWLGNGVGEYCLRRASEKSVTRQIASRIKSGTLWTLAQLFGAESLYKVGTKASFDYRPIYAQAGSVVEYMLEAPDAFREISDQTSGHDRVFEGLQRVAALRTTGKERVAALYALLGEDVEGHWKAWAQTWRGQ